MSVGAVVEWFVERPYLTFSLAFSSALFVFEKGFLGYRETRVTRRAVIPNTLKEKKTQKEFEKARSYKLDKINFGFWHGIFDHVVTMVTLAAGFLAVFWDIGGNVLGTFGVDASTNEVLQTVVFAALLSCFNFVVSFGWKYASVFYLEAKHGFNKQTLGFFIKDQLKKLVLELVLNSALLSAVVWVVRHTGSHFYLYCWLFTFGVSLFMIAVYQDYIAPLFDKYVPLPEGELRTKIEALAQSLNFPLSELLLVKGSMRSSHSNAYFYGFFNSKKIVLFDTLLPPSSSDNSEEEENNEEEDNDADADGAEEESNEYDGGEDGEEKEERGCSDEQIVAVLSHELGHWKHNHVIKMFTMQQAVVFFYFLAFSKLINLEGMYTDFGFHDSKPVVIGLTLVFSYLLSPVSTVLGFLVTAYTRKNEFQADRFAVSLNNGDDLKNALIKLHKDNSSFPVNDWLFSMLHHSHPPIVQRLAAIDEEMKKKQ
eukprot:m.58587 g.58587  ORF g.58587 m.58587 type:complete len:482 (-) comp11273_c0_seq1:100-1545(-)